MRAPLLVLLLFSALAGCDDADDDSASPTSFGEGPGDAAPMMTPEEATPPDRASELMQAALELCLRTLDDAEIEIANACRLSTEFSVYLTEAARLHGEARAAAPTVPGRSALVRLASGPGDIDRSGSTVSLLSCGNNPIAPPDCAARGNCPPPLNAFAMTHTTYFIDALLLAFYEGAAWWGALANAAGGDPDRVNGEQLFQGLGEIFFANAQGRPFTVVSLEDAQRLLENDPFTRSVAVEALLFLVFHEVGHAILAHSLINHTLRAGIETILAAEGRQLTQAEVTQIQAELLRVKVGTETQADIYGATLLSALGGTSYGPRLFTVGMAAFTARAGVCDPSLPSDQLYACIVGNNPNASHPPLDVRTQIVTRILDQGEDLTHLLEVSALGQ